MSTTMRPIKRKDLSELKKVLDSSELFPSELLDDMISDYLNNPESEDIWFTATENNIPISIAYCAPERLTEGTYNLYAIAVRNDYQGKGIGRQMMDYLESQLRDSGKRILIVETSSLDDYILTRKFYEKCDYIKEAVIRDFYTKGEDKVVFWKNLSEVI